MPKQTPGFNDEQIVPVAGEGTPTEVRPGVVGWTPKVEADRPAVLLVYIGSIGDTSEPLLQSVTLTDPVAKTVTIDFYPTKDTRDTPVFSKTVSIPDSGTITVYLSEDDKLPIPGQTLVITLGEPKSPDATVYDTTVALVGCFEPLLATTTTAAATTATTTAAVTTAAATSSPAGTTASTTVPPTTTTAAETTTTTTLATVTTTATTAGTTTTVLCPLEYLMGEDGSEPLIPLDQVTTTKDTSSVESKAYGGPAKPWGVTAPTDDSAQRPTMTYQVSGPGIDSAPQVTSVSLNPNSNVKTVTVTVTSPTGETTTFQDVPVSPEGQVEFTEPFVLLAKTVEIVLVEPVDASIGEYNVSPNIQGCFRAATTTTIVVPTTTTAGTATPSTTTISTVSTTGTVVTTTTPTVTTTLTQTATPTVGTTQVTTAVVTTTTTAGVTTAFVCPLSEKMPTGASNLSSSVFTLVRGDGLPYEILPGQIGWKPSVNLERPVLQIDLLAGTGTMPLLQSVTITDAIAQFITVVIFGTRDTSGLPTFSKTVPLENSGKAVVYLRPDRKLIEAAIVELILGEPMDKLASNYDTVVSLVGCFERTAASSTVGTTNVVPGTTFSSTVPPGLSTIIETTPTHPTSVLTTTVASTIPQYCSEPFEYTECLCHKTCNNMAQSSTTVCATLGDSACQMGCQCPQGMVMNNGTCIIGADCPCYYNGKFYQFGETVASATEKCVSLICTVQGMTRSFDPICASTETCTNGRVFQQCPCEKTCQQPNHVCEMALCTAGCACSAGMLWNGSACVEQAECYCFANDVMHTNNDRWIANECTLCSCVNGTQACSEYCSISETECKTQGKTLLNRDLQDGICCRCVSNDAHCMFENEEKPIGSTWHVGLCASYECALSSDGLGTIEKTMIQCMECQVGEEVVYTADRCCPYCFKTENATELNTTTSVPITTTPFSPGITTGFSTLFTTTSSFTTTGIFGEGDIVTGSPTVSPEFEYSSTGTTIFTSSVPPPTGVPPRTCGEVMTGASQLPDDRVGIYPSSLGSADVVRGPEASGLMATPADQAVIVLQLSQPNSTLPTLLQSIVITGNVKTVGVAVKNTPTGEFEPYSGGEYIDVTSGALSFTESSPEGILVYEVRLLFVEAIVSDSPYAARLQVYACLNDFAETTNVTGTTPPGTTTPATVAPGTTISPPVCSEVMQDASQLPDSKIELSPSTVGSPASLRGPTAEGWMVNEADEPHITIDLTDSDGFRHAILERLNVYGNLRTVQVLLKTSMTGGYEAYMGGEPIDVTSGILSFAEGSDKGIPVYGIQLVLLQPIMSDLPYALRLKVYACISGAGVTTTLPPLVGSTSATPPTSVATTTAPPTCSEVMDGDYQLPESRIVISPTTSGDAAAFRGAGAPGWMVTPADSPKITLQLTKPGTEEPTLLEKVDIYGNVKTISVSVKTLPSGEFEPYKDGVDVTSGTLSFVEGVNKGIMVYAVQISLLETSSSDLPFALRLQVFACVKDLAETTTVISTTTIGGIATTPNFDDFIGTGSPTANPLEPGTTTMHPGSTFTTGIGFTTLPGTTLLPGTSTAGSTTGPTTSPPRACTEVMTDEAKLPDSSIELSPSTIGSPSSLRGPKAEGWSVTQQDEPAITINLLPTTSTHPAMLESIVFFGNLRTVSVMVKPTQTGAFEPYKGGEAIDVTSGKLSFTTATEEGIMVYGVQVLLLETVMSDLPFTVRLQVYACLSGIDTHGAPETTGTTEVITGGTTPAEAGETTTVPGTTTPPAQVNETTVPGTTQPPSTVQPTTAPTTPCVSESQSPPTDKCSYGGTVYELNSVWTDTQSVCLSCTCLTGGVTCRNLQESCDLTCAGELVKVEGQCCPVCQPSTKAEFCSISTVDSSALIDGCTPDEPIQQSTCTGSCTSTVETSLTSSSLSGSFRSCQALGSKEVTVSLTCANGEKRTHTYTTIISCGCAASCMCAASNPFQ